MSVERLRNLLVTSTSRLCNFYVLSTSRLRHAGVTLPSRPTSINTVRGSSGCSPKATPIDGIIYLSARNKGRHTCRNSTRLSNIRDIQTCLYYNDVIATYRRQVDVTT